MFEIEGYRRLQYILQGAGFCPTQTQTSNLGAVDMILDKLKNWLRNRSPLITAPETPMTIDISKQLKAFRDVLAYSEGTDKPSVQFSRNRGYDVIVGGGLLTDYSHHPRVLVYLPRYKIKSSAAGRYQFIWPTWKELQKRLHLPDFSPASQDRACDAKLRECGAVGMLAAGRFDDACRAANKIWASLPGSPYGQRTENLATLRAIFIDRGGVIR